MQSLLSDWLRLEDEFSIRNRIRTSLLAWATEALASSGQRPAAHHRLLLTELDSLTRGTFDRLMVLMPPGSAKSTYASVLFPAWWFTQHPRTSIIAASHTSRLAEHFSRRVRVLIASHQAQLGYTLRHDERAASHWRTSTGGEYIASGVRSAISGRRADLAIIDDPVRSQSEADSATHRDHLWQWYRSDLITRLKPGARMILIMTRWHENDLGGQLASQGDAGWRILRLPALAEQDDPLGRAPGEPLWPEWEGHEALIRKRNTVGERVWAALFQQAPRPATGGLFKVSCLAVADHPVVADEDRVVRAWDLAATIAAGTNDPDWTVGVKLLCDASGRYTVLDVVRLRGTPRQVEDLIVATAGRDGKTVWIGLPEDPGQAGKSQIAYLAGRLSGYRIRASRETGSKLTRALPVASQVEANNMAIVRGDWNRAFLEELADFPMGRKDDQVDALVRAFTTLAQTTAPARKIAVPFLVR